MTLAKDIASHLLKIQAVYLKPEEPFNLGIRYQVTDLYGQPCERLPTQKLEL